MSDNLHIEIDGRPLEVPGGITVAGAILLSGPVKFRTSVKGEPRAPLCGMGICFECRVTINGRSDCRSCQIFAQTGMVIATS